MRCSMCWLAIRVGGISVSSVVDFAVYISDFIFDSYSGYLVLCVFVCRGGVGNFYSGIGVGKVLL